ncbi:hypothetical protein [Neptuniibacter sp. QD37_11]|uniref:hypothetical protein n=1 Tax=Neptuniibacter sp. QD37_11 TaxID=3398209 RepID=UPI0039F55069
MDREQLFLAKLAEESIEICIEMEKLSAQIPVVCFSNTEDFKAEVNDLLGVIQLLNVEFGFNYTVRFDSFKPSPNQLLVLPKTIIRTSLDLSKLALKAQQFGLSDQYTGYEENIAVRLHRLLDELFAAIAGLKSHYGINFSPRQDSIAAKMEKINKFAEYSKEKGLLQN